MRKNDRLDPDKIRDNLKTKRVGKKVVVYESTSSTNDIAAEYARNKDNDGLVILAEQQSAGRGRGVNKWQSKAYESILCSVLLTKGKFDPDLLCLTCAVAVAEAIGKLGSKEAKIKWPNDIVVGGKKIAGILLEMKRRSNRTVYIVGIGINCHQKAKSFPVGLQKTATSIDIESRTVSERVVIIKRVLSSMEHWLSRAEKTPEKVINRWKKLSILLGHRITVAFKGKKFTGNCIGLDPQKGLILQLDIGGVRMFDAAHTSIVK